MDQDIRGKVWMNTKLQTSQLSLSQRAAHSMQCVPPHNTTAHAISFRGTNYTK